MFRSRRTTLVKRLWKERVSPQQHETSSPSEIHKITRQSDLAKSLPHRTISSSDSHNNNPSSLISENLELKSVTHSLLKRLKEKQLETLIQSVESKGGETTDCVLLPKGEMRLGKRTVTPEVLCCQLWRWPTLHQTMELKRVPCCRTRNDPAYVCCNPYHWSILVQPDPPPIGNKTDLAERLQALGQQPSPAMEDPVSTETGLTPSYRKQNATDDSTTSRGPLWCQIAYWEHQNRIGNLFPVFERSDTDDSGGGGGNDVESIHVFQDLPHGNGFSIGVLHAQHKPEHQSVRKTREKIGYGVTLSKEGDAVWVYNRSGFPIFVNSPTLANPNSWTPYVCKVLPGHTLKMFDFADCELLKVNDFRDGPFDLMSVRISFAKGWGRSSYSRQIITSCPCWIEVLLRVDR